MEREQQNQKIIIWKDQQIENVLLGLRAYMTERLRRKDWKVEIPKKKEILLQILPALKWYQDCVNNFISIYLKIKIKQKCS